MNNDLNEASVLENLFNAFYMKNLCKRSQRRNKPNCKLYPICRKNAPRFQYGSDEGLYVHRQALQRKTHDYP